ncbi:MAG: DNA translocase FtsK 4TM domain-containing protein, partial [Planctomycetota bacterium]
MLNTQQKSNRPTKLLIGVFLIILTIFLMVSLVSHTTTDNPDQHYTDMGKTGFSNWGGRIGDFFATDLFLLFGIVSYLIVAMIGLWGVFLIRRKQISIISLKIFSLIIFIIASLTFADLITPSGFTSGRMESLGGISGSLLAKFITRNLGSVGGYLVTLFILGASLILATDWLAYDITARFSRAMYNVFAKVISYLNSFRRKMDQKQKTDRMIQQLQHKQVIPPAINADTSLPPIENNEEEDKKTPTPHITDNPAQQSSQLCAGTKQPKGEFKLPGLELLEDPEEISQSEGAEEVKDKIKVIEETLHNFGVEAKIVNVERGPVVTKYEIELAPGISIHKVAGMIDDLSIALKSPNVTIESPLPGKSTVGLDVPNTYKGIVRLKELITVDGDDESVLPLFLGKDAAGTPVIRDLDDMPHLLIAGTTGSGKSICIGSIILSLLMKRTP